MIYSRISIPEQPGNYWRGTTDVRCPCGGLILHAEVGYAPGFRACDRCLVLYRVRGHGRSRALVPQTCFAHPDPRALRLVIDDAPPETPVERLERVPEWYFWPRELRLWYATRE